MNNDKETKETESFLKEDTDLNRLAKDIAEIKVQLNILLSDVQGLLDEIEDY